MAEVYRLRGVRKVRAGGRIYYYWRATKERLPNDPHERAARVALLTAKADAKERREKSGAVAWEDGRPLSGVYLIGSSGGHIKIGVSHNPTARLNEMQVANANSLFILLYLRLPADQAPLVEGAMHQKLAQYRVRGEWFNVDLQHAAETLLGVTTKLQPWIETNVA